MNKFKKLIEKREQILAEMELLTNTAETEERALTEDEQAKFDAYEKEIRAIDATVKTEERARALNTVTEKEDKPAKKAKLSRVTAEERAFEAYLRGHAVEVRADGDDAGDGEGSGEGSGEGETVTVTDQNMTKTENGAVIPSSIAKKIITKVVEISPLYQKATRYNVKGTLSIPYYDEDTSTINVAYADEFEELTSTSGSFKSIQLQAFLAGALTKVSKSLINNSQFDIVSFVVDRMAKAVARFLEKELLKGSTDYAEGLSTATQVVTTASSSAITSDELIDLQDEVPDVYQTDSIWIMNKKTRTAIRKMKDGQGNYLLEKDATAKWGYRLFGKDVYVSDFVDQIATGNTVIYYGDFSGLAVKLSEDMDIQILREKFATQHAVGVVTWIEFDSKIENQQKIAVMKMA